MKQQLEQKLISHALKIAGLLEEYITCEEVSDELDNAMTEADQELLRLATAYKLAT